MRFRVQFKGLNFGDVMSLHPERNLTPRFRSMRDGAREVTYASLQREKLWILRTKEFFGLPCSLLLRVTTPLNFEESNRSMPRDSVLLTHNLYWMLWIR
jgi:hypothetical protein